ncbi:MAG: CRTAC1 family protein [Paracoccaceae bacterium]|nr:MAG: CRTAC1 family protein [Paracoccaceae bacterium]
MIRAALLLSLAIPATATAQRFEAQDAGLSDGIFRGEWQYMVGGGAAAFDCSGDGFPDLYVAGGEDPARLYVNESSPGGPLRFRRTAAAETDLAAVTGAYPLDVDGDGITDLAVLRVGENVLLRGLGDCRFERANEPWGFDGGDGWTTAFAATWEAGSNWPTLATGDYIDRHEEAFPWGSCTPNRLFRPGPQGFAAPLDLLPSHCPLSIMFTDWNRDGTADLRVSNDREYYKGGQEQMWAIPPGQAPRLYTAEEGWRYLRLWGMGIASRDVTGDGLPDYFLTSMADNKLQVLADAASGRPDYADVAARAGVTAHRPHAGGDIRPSTAWHAQFEDVDNDGRADLWVAKGNVSTMPDFANADPNNLLMQGDNGSFTERSAEAGVASLRTARGGVLADFDLDGRVDILAVNRWEPPEIWRNTTDGAGNWLQLRLAMPGANRDGIGAWVEVRTGARTQPREIFVGAGHVSGHLGWVHFGLGAATSAEVRVIWPHAAPGDWQAVAANGFLTLSPGAAPQPWQPPR